MEYFRPLWSCFTAFCSCLHCSDDLGNQNYEPSERTHLLVDPIDHSPAMHHAHLDINLEYSSSLLKKDDQNALCRLVQNAALNMIDVGAMDTHNLEPQECHDRIQLYKQRLLQQWNNIPRQQNKPTGLLKDITNTVICSTNVTVSDDLFEMRTTMQKVHMALSKIKIQHHEPIVVPFRIP